MPKKYSTTTNIEYTNKKNILLIYSYALPLKY